MNKAYKRIESIRCARESNNERGVLSSVLDGVAMKIREYGEIHFDGHLIVVKGWRVEMEGKQQPMTEFMTEFFVKICEELSKNPNVRWVFEANEFIPARACVEGEAKDA